MIIGLLLNLPQTHADERG